jgi:hypothetical protein
LVCRRVKGACDCAVRLPKSPNSWLVLDEHAHPLPCCAGSAICCVGFGDEGRCLLRQAAPFGEGPRHLFRENDNKYADRVTRMAVGVGIEALRTPYGVRKANAACERLLGSVRQECVDHLLILNQRHLRCVMEEYGESFNHTRAHQGIGQRLPHRQESRDHPLARGKVVLRLFLRSASRLPLETAGERVAAQSGATDDNIRRGQVMK